jgi:hypothetical protein
VCRRRRPERLSTTAPRTRSTSSSRPPRIPTRRCLAATPGRALAAKQNARVSAGLDAGYNPFWQLLDPTALGLVGHSYGAAGVSYIAQWDQRVKAVVALDNLGGKGPHAAPVPGASGKSTIGEAACPANPADRTTVPITKPGLGASYYGPDITDWYITAWFDKYLRHARGADAMLLSDRWRHYAPEAAIDPNHDGNAVSFYYYSRLDIHLAGGQPWDREDLRAGCPAMVPAGQDGYAGNYSYDAVREARLDDSAILAT